LSQCLEYFRWGGVISLVVSIPLAIRCDIDST